MTHSIFATLKAKPGQEEALNLETAVDRFPPQATPHEH